jgi:GxxExxY protein
MLEQELTEKIIGAFIEVHKTVGPGLLESAYEQCVCHELRLRGLSFRRQVDLPVEYKGVELDCAYRMDILVEETIVTELKCVEHILPVHRAQLLTYLKLSGKRVGLLVNFLMPVLKDGLVRMVL